MEGWNGSGGKAAAKAPARRRTPWAVFAAAVFMAVALAAALLFFSGGNREGRRHSDDKRGRIADAAPVKAAKNAEAPARKSAKEVAAEFNEQAKDFIKKPSTNNVYWVIPPLAPDDPDNALRTAVAQDIASLLSIVPGEEIPPIIPFHFMLEDEEADEDGRRVSDGGNAEFLESLKKWKVTIKEGDSEECADIKQRFVDAQLELLDGIDKGLTVNDSIRAAYEYRKRAAATRSALIEAIKDIHDKDPDIEATRELIAAANKKLEEEGILAINTDDVIGDYDADGKEQSSE